MSTLSIFALSADEVFEQAEPLPAAVQVAGTAPISVRRSRASREVILFRLLVSTVGIAMLGLLAVMCVAEMQISVNHNTGSNLPLATHALNTGDASQATASF